MVVTQNRSRLKPSGSRYIAARKKRRYEKGSLPANTLTAARNVRNIRGMGGNHKVKLLATDVANVFNAKSRKYAKAKIISVVENPANSFFVRRNIMTRGAIINTELGKARVTSRPGQHGTINAVLVE